MNPFLSGVQMGLNGMSSADIDALPVSGGSVGPVPSGTAYGQQVAQAAMAPPPPPPPEPAQQMSPPVQAPPAEAMMSRAPAPPPGPQMSMAPPVRPAPEAMGDPLSINWRPVVMGGTPAREVKVVGPQVEKIQHHTDTAQREAAGQILERSQSVQNQAALAASVDVDKAQAYEDAARARMEQHSQQLESSRQEYLRSVDDLAKSAALDPDRIYTRPETQARIGAAMVAGIFSGLTGSRENRVLDSIQRDQELDIMAQKDAYARGLDVAKGKQTAFGMAMDRFQNEGMAEAAVRAAMTNTQLAQARMQKATASSAEEANAYDKLMADLTARLDEQRMAGLRFVPATTGGVMYQGVQAGHVIPGLFTAKEAQKAELDKGVDARQKAAFTDAEGTTKVALAQIEQQGKMAGKANEDAKHISQQLVTQGIPQARAAAEEALKAINSKPRGYTERVVRAAIPGAAPHLLSDEDNAREQAYQNFMNQSMKALMGNVTASEEVRAARVYGGNDNARKKSIDLTLKQLDEQEKAIKGGANIGSQQTYAQQAAAATTGQPMAPSSAQKGHR